MGVCYRDGLGTEQDLEEAEKYFQLSADQGYEPAQENLAGLGEVKSAKEAEKRETYQDAINLFFDRKYEEARAAFESLGDYERSADFMRMCDEATQEPKEKKGVPVSAVDGDSLGENNDQKEATVTYDNGDVYTGEIKDGKRNG